MPRYEIFPYSIEKLKELFSTKSRATSALVKLKHHIGYFEDYFKELKAKSILIENEYVDRDFLDDFCGYYIRCFADYERKCKRFHFFDIEITDEEFVSLLKGNEGRLSKDSLQKAYLGFLVIKPLPQTIIGRTCLKTYPSDGNRRHFPVTRSYEANLFGIPLKIENTLAFQEQDHVVAACATNALWSMFQITGLNFNHPIHSPIEITKMASALSPLDPTRTLPNEGLTKAQMAHTIRTVGLEPYPVAVQDEYILKNTLYEYLTARIPMVLIFFLYNEKERKIIGRHAVTLTGYSLGAQEATPYGQTGFLSRASRIDKIYVHDDQVGPFARMVFDGKKIVLEDEKDKSVGMDSVSTSWQDKEGERGNIRALPELVLIPLYHKIRLPFYLINGIVSLFDNYIEEIRRIIPIPNNRPEWDIHLTTVNDLKREILASDFFKNQEYRLEILLKGMPRFIWRAIAWNSNMRLIELLFDATDIEQGPFFICAIEHNKPFSVILRQPLKDPNLIEALRIKPHWKILEWFEKNPLF